VRAESLRDVLEVVEREIAMLAGRIDKWLADDARLSGHPGHSRRGAGARRGVRG